MKPLSPEARKALGALSASEPSASDEARVRQNLERTLGVVLPAAAVGVTTVATTATAAVTTTTTTSATATTASITALGLGAKVTLFVAALTVGSVATLAIRSSLSLPQRGEGRGEGPAKSPPPPRASPAPVVVEPEPVVQVEVPVAAPEPEPVVVTPAPSTPTPTPTPPTKRTPLVAKLTEEPEAPVAVEPVPEPTTPPSAPPPPPTLATAQSQADFATVVELQFPTCDAAVEARTATAARALLNEDRAPHALLLLSEYQRQCVSGQWSDEAWRVRLSSLCKLDRNKEATTLFEWFASEYPKRRQAIERELRVNCAPSVLGE